MSQCEVSGKQGKEGVTFVVEDKDGFRFAVKMFKKTKSSRKIQKEAEMQEDAARVGVSPRVFAVNLTEKFIVMECLKETIVDHVRQGCADKSRVELSGTHQNRLIEICDRLDDVNIMQNDGNPLNLMVDDAGMLFVIDFGFAKRIDARLLRKRGPKPNTNTTLWHFQRSLQKYRIGASKCEKRVEEYMKEFLSASKAGR